MNQKVEETMEAKCSLVGYEFYLKDIQLDSEAAYLAKGQTWMELQFSIQETSYPGTEPKPSIRETVKTTETGGGITDQT